MKRGSSRVSAATIVSFALALLVASPVYAAPTYVDIAGYATTSQYTWYSSIPRYITQPELAGPEIVHKQYTGPNGLELGAYRCGQMYTFPWGRYPQDFNVYRTVADGVPYSTCFYLFTLSDSGTGNFTGRLGWDG